MERATGGSLYGGTHIARYSVFISKLECFHPAAENGDREHLGGQLTKANLALSQNGMEKTMMMMKMIPDFVIHTNKTLAHRA